MTKSEIIESQNKQLDLLYKGFNEMHSEALNLIDDNHELLKEIDELKEVNQQLLEFIDSQGLNFERKFIN